MSAQMNLERGLMATVKESLTVQLIASCFRGLTEINREGLLCPTIPAKPSDLWSCSNRRVTFFKGGL